MSLRLFLLLCLPVFAWSLRGADGVSVVREVDGRALFPEGQPKWDGLLTDPAALVRAASGARDYLKTAVDPLGAHAGLLSEQGVVLSDVVETLERAAALAQAGQLGDPAVLEANFRAFRWKKPSDDRIRLTKYLVWQVEGSLSRDSAHPYALYAIPNDEAGLSRAEADARPELLRHRYSRQQILGGVFEAGGAAAGQARPLVWLSREMVLQALLQGTVEVKLPDGVTRRYNVHRPNDFPYVAGLSPEEQKRYWYFQEVETVLGWGPEGGPRIPVISGVTVAGDVHNLGAGKLLLLRDGARSWLVVLGDTGGAFTPNLHQLDLYAGAFPNRTAFAEGIRGLPEYVEAWVLVRR